MCLRATFNDRRYRIFTETEETLVKLYFPERRREKTDISFA